MAVRDVVQAAAGQGGDKLYVEDVFSTYLYTGNGSTQTINNGIDLAGEGGLVWTKARNLAVGHYLVDTERGVSKYILTNGTAAEGTSSGTLDAFNSNGYSLGSLSGFNGSGYNYASWTLRKAPKFFDVVTWTGDGTLPRAISHNLGSTPGFIIAKSTSGAGHWVCFHRNLGSSQRILLNSTGASAGTNAWGSSAGATPPTDSVFYVGTDSTSNNTSGVTYVAYLFAHDAGGFGDDGEQNVISCGSYTGNGSSTGPVINLGWEPQWVLIKKTNEASDSDWMLFDNMRGIATGGDDPYIKANSANIEWQYDFLSVTATGFQLTSTYDVTNGNGDTYIYIAIRRPMKTPESGTEVFMPTAYSPTDPYTVTTGFPVDAMFNGPRIGGAPRVWDRLRGGKTYLYSWLTNAENTDNVNQMKLDNNTGFVDDFNNSNYGAVYPTIGWNFKRATGFMDVVCYTGTGSTQVISHNLGVAPDLYIVKRRSGAANWTVKVQASIPDTVGWLDSSNKFGVPAYSYGFIYGGSSPITSFVAVNGATNGTAANASGDTYVAYLFASLAGVSKFGKYSGTGGNVNVDCGFSAGARFILIKRTDSTGDWYVWDSVRGIVAGNDPYLLLNSTAAEVTSTDYIDPLSSGFTVTSSAPAALNASGGTYIFLAIA